MQNEDIQIIENIINKALKEENELYGEINPERVNRDIYQNIFKMLLIQYKTNVDISVRKTLLDNYILDLDKTRIKTPEEYYTDLINAPFYAKNGSVGYFAPERFVSKKIMTEMEKAKIKNFEEVGQNPLNTKEHIIAPINPLYVDTQDECNFDINMPLDELVSLTYLKHMYNRPMLDSCRSLIKFKIIHGEMLRQENMLFLSKIDKYLYRIYLERHNIAAKNAKTRAKKTKAKRNKKTKARRNKKTQKK